MSDSKGSDLSGVVIGTGRLGRGLPNAYKANMCETIVQALALGANLHVSPTYGKSFSYLKKFRMPDHLQNRVIVKVDFSKQSVPELQIRLARDLFPDHKRFEVQITGDLRPRSLLRHNLRDDFFDYIERLKNEYGIAKYFLSPLYHDCESLERFAERRNMSWAVHGSLIEREFTEGFMDRRSSDNQELLFLRGFGEGLQQFGDWFSQYTKQAKPSNVLQDQRDCLASLLREYEISEDYARLFYILNHPSNSLPVLSVSRETQLERLIEVGGAHRDDALWTSLDAYSKTWANYGRRMVGFFYPPDTSYSRNHSMTSLVKACLSLRQSEATSLALFACRGNALRPARFGVRAFKAVGRRIKPKVMRVITTRDV